MSRPSSARALSRLALVAATAVVAGLCAVVPASADTGTYDNSGSETPTSTGTLGTGVGQKLTGAQMVARARDWVSHQVSYNQSQSFSDSEVGGPYRTDCGGLVDMAWQLTSSPVVTTPSPGIDSSTYSTKLSSWSQLQPGDALAVAGEHINLFAGWTNQANGDFTYIAEDNPSVRTGEYPANIHDASIDGYPTSSFELLRSNSLAPAVPANFNVTLDANGQAIASGQTVSGTVNLTAVASSQGVVNSLTYSITGPNGTQTINGGTGADNYAQAWNTTGLPGGSYTISATANETDGQNHTYGPFTVTVAALPRSSSSGLTGLPNGGYTTAWRGGDGNLWVGTGSGTSMAQPAEPWLLGVAKGTKPSIATLTDGTWVTAWVGADGNLWVGTGSGTTMAKPVEPWLLGVAPGTSPSIVALPNGSWEVAWKGGDGDLWLGTGTGLTMAKPAEPWLLGVADTTSPSLAALPNGGYEVAWKGNDGNLWVGTGSGTSMSQPAEPWLLGVGSSGSSSSPSLVTMADGSFEVAWKGGDGYLWLGAGSGTSMAKPAEPWLLGVADTTSPSLAALPNGGYQVAWKGNDGNLWVGTGSGTSMSQPAEPWLLGVGSSGTSFSPSLVTMADGSFEVAWKGGDGYLWLGAGSGTSMAKPAEPWLLGVA